MQTESEKKHWPMATGKIEPSVLDRSHTPSYTLMPAPAPSSSMPRTARMIMSTAGTGMVKYTNMLSYLAPFTVVK